MRELFSNDDCDNLFPWFLNQFFSLRQKAVHSLRLFGAAVGGQLLDVSQDCQPSSAPALVLLARCLAKGLRGIVPAAGPASAPLI